MKFNRAGAIFFLLASACATEPKADLMQQRSAKAAEHVRESFDESGPGVAYLISQNGRVLAFGGKGIANAEWDQKMAPDTAVRIGSLSKPITAILVLQLAEKGLVDLDIPVSNYAPELPSHFGAVTMRQYLSHRSGVSDFLMDPALLEHIWLPITTSKLIDLAKDSAVSFPPGAKYEYVNFNYVIVANVIEKVTGRSYQDIVNEFFAINGMTNSHFDQHGAIIKNRAAPYELRDGDIFNIPGLDLSHLSAAGALLSSASDLNRWALLLTSNALVREENREMAWTPAQLPDGTPTSYGLGFNASEMCGARIISHTGLAPGGQAAIMLAPEQGLITVILSNAYNTPSTGKLTREMMAAMLVGDEKANCASN